MTRTWTSTGRLRWSTGSTTGPSASVRATGVAAALGNPHWRATIAWAGEKIMPFLQESGLVGGPGMPFWRKSFLLSEAV